MSLAYVFPDLTALVYMDEQGLHLGCYSLNLYIQVKIITFLLYFFSVVAVSVVE